MKFNKVKFKQWNCNVVIARYVNNNKAITLIDAEDGSPVATATVNLTYQDVSDGIASYDLYRKNKNLVHIKTWSEGV